MLQLTCRIPHLPKDFQTVHLMTSCHMSHIVSTDKLVQTVRGNRSHQLVCTKYHQMILHLQSIQMRFSFCSVVLWTKMFHSHSLKCRFLGYHTLSQSASWFSDSVAGIFYLRSLLLFFWLLADTQASPQVFAVSAM